MLLKALYERTRIMEEQRLVMDNDLKNLGRMELLQVLLKVTESNEALMAENAELRSASPMQVARSAKVGSIAEAALQANGFFEAAQRSADDYLREIKRLRDEMVERSKAQQAQQASRSVSDEEQLEQSQLFERIQDQAKTYIQDVQTYANNVMARANTQAQGIIDDARMRSEEIIAQANSQAQAIVGQAETRAVQSEPVPAAGLPVESPSNGEAPESGLSAAELPKVEPVEEPPSAAEPVEEPPSAVEPEADEAEEAGAEALGERAPAEEEAPREFAPDQAANGGVSEEGVVQGDAANEGPQGAASESTARLDIDVIVSDIAAEAFTENELDPGSTGALVRRGRHVKLPEGTTV